MTHLIDENFASFKHSLGKPLLNISSALRNIESALNRFNADWSEVKVSKKSDLTLKDSFG